MGCPATVEIGKNLVFSICTHDPDTGVLTDADDAPAYRVYEDETATAILTGTMAKLDDTNTTGFYTEIIACTAANGFEHEKTYTIYIAATVDSDTGGICYSFKAHNASAIQKGVALSNFKFFMTDTADDITAKTGLTVTAQIAKDGGAFATCSNSVSEISNGWYKITLTATEMNAAIVALRFSATGANTENITIVTGN